MSTQDHLQLEKKEQEDDDKNELTGIGVVGRNVSKVIDPVGKTVESVLSPVGWTLNGVLQPITDGVGRIIKPLTIHPDESEIKKEEKKRLEKEWAPIGGKEQNEENPLGLRN